MPRNKKLFHYNKKIDQQIVAAAEKVLKIPVKRAVKMKHGEVNLVFKLTTQKQNFLARIFRYKDWQEAGKLVWIERQLTRHNIPHAKILYYSRSNKFFPFGFMITEFIAGYNGEVAVDKRQLTLAEAYFKIGQVLKRVHKIKVKRFGKINSGKGSFSNFLELKLKKDVFENFKELRPMGKFFSNLAPVVAERVKECLFPFEKRFKPVLNHGDPNRENAIWSAQKQWVLIDWDNAIASTWLEDYADLTFWADFRHDKSFTARRLKIFVKNFFLGYGRTDFNPQEINRIEYALHILKCMKLLTYYYFYKKDMGNFIATKKKLLSLLEKNF